MRSSALATVRRLLLAGAFGGILSSPPALADEPSLGLPPDTHRGVVLSERSESKDDAPRPLRLAIHVHSTVSTGELEPGRIVELARQAGVDGVIFTDSALRRWEYGLWPLRGLVKRALEEPSVETFGAERYLAALRNLHAQAPDILVMAALEVAPFYYWQRSPFDQQGGQIRNWHQHLLVIGLDDPRAIQRVSRGTADPYHGNQGAVPYQRLIDEVHAHRGLVFWAHPEMSHIGRYGPVEAYTDPYAHLLHLTEGYDGFAITYLDRLSFVEPGAVWDELLMAYCRGQRARPVWIIGELDWRAPHERPLDQIVTVVSAASRTAAAVLDALRHGRMWAVFRIGQQAPALEQFDVRDESPGPVRITLRGHSGTEEGQRSEIVLVRNGTAWQTETVETAGFELTWTDAAPQRPGYYRAIVKTPAGLIYTNPVFVHR